MTFKKFTDLPETSKEAEDDGWTKTASCGGRYNLCHICMPHRPHVNLLRHAINILLL